MKKNYFYFIGLLLVVLCAGGCACKHWDWVCTNCPPKTEASQPSVVKEVKVAPAQVVVPALPADPAPAQKPAMQVGALSFGDHKSVTLTTKAWQALAAKNMDAAIAYAGKCVDMYSSEAVKMQGSLKEYPSGDPQRVFSYWALNDVATALFIQGEAYRKMKKDDQARFVYQRVINEFSYGQAYDPASKTFWKPADAARDGLYMIEKGLDLDFGNMTSYTIVSKMWGSLAAKKLEEVIAYDMKMESLYSERAREMQAFLKEYPQLPAENIHKFWALNDVGTGMFILAEAYKEAGMNADALKAYKRVVSEYFYAQCWDPQGWFWKPADAAQQKIYELEAQK